MYPQQETGLLLSGLDGANPLAFLAALGTLRGLTLAWPDHRVCLSWAVGDAWRPCVSLDGGIPSQDEILGGLELFLKERPGHEALAIGDNLRMATDRFRACARAAALAATPGPAGRAAADFIAALACDSVESVGGQGNVQDTALRTMSGTGHQHFLKTMRDLSEKVGHEMLRRCLFGQWERADPQLSLRWDPEDDRRYALRWRDPSKDTVSAKGKGSGAPTEWGANRLAFEALPLFPVMPLPRGARTTGFSGNRSRDTYWIWPVWDCPVDLDIVRSLLAMPEIQGPAVARRKLGAMGIRQLFRSQRINVGQYRNFTPSSPV